MKKYTVAVIGLGRMGSFLDMSIANAAKESDRIELVAGADLLAERRTKFNDDWGVLYERSFPRAAPVVQASVNGSNQYVFEEFFSQGQSRSARASIWSLRFGFNYRF